MRLGAVVGYKDKKDLVLACVIDVAQDRLRVVTEKGKEFSFPADKILGEYSSGGAAVTSRERILEMLRASRERLEEIRADTSLEDLWELLASDEDDEAKPAVDLAKLYYGDSCGLPEVLALLSLLGEDAIYFKQKGKDFLARNVQQVQEILRQKQVEEQKQKERELVVRWLAAVMSGGGAPPPPPPGAERQIELLKGWAIHQDSFENQKDASALLREIGPADPQTAFNLLVQAGIWGPDENLLIHRFQIPVEFPVEVLAAQAALVATPQREIAPERDAGREDLTHLTVFSIDDEETRDIDDALSVEEEATGLRVGIHISDASHYVTEGVPLDSEAYRRGATIYLPDTRIPMLPGGLSEGLLSLVAGEDRRAMSILVEFTPELVLKGFRLVPSWVRVTHRLTYVMADEMLERVRTSAGEPEGCPAGLFPAMARLRELGRKLRQERERQGALIFSAPEIKIKVGENGDVSVKKVPADTESHLVVSELMILTNQLVAGWFREHQLPAIYRFQPPLEEPVAISGYDPVMFYRMRRLVKKSEHSLAPLPHAGLGIPAYLQFTSPIRRYTDLVLHRQARGFLAGEGIKTSLDEMGSVMAAFERNQDVIGLIQRQTHRYWILRYAQQLVGIEVPGIVLERKDDQWVILLSDLLLEVPLHARPETKLEVGQHVMVKVVSVSPRRNQIRIQ